MATSGRAAVGHPVDVATGTLFNYYQDFALRGMIELSFVRFYSTALLAASSGVLGYGFRHNYQHELRQSLEGFVYVDFEGNEQTLPDDGSFATTGKLVFPAKTLELRGSRDRIELVNYGDPSRTVLVFERRNNSRHYNLVSMRSRKNNRLDLAYDAAQVLTTVTQTRTGHTLNFKYDGLGRIAEVVFIAGVRDLVAAFTYDLLGDLVQVTDPAGVAAQYQYDDHYMTSESVRGGSVHEFRYDSQRRVIQASAPNNYDLRRLSFDAAAKTTIVADSKGAETIYEYNSSGQITRKTDAMGRSTQLVYDDDGRIVSETNRAGATITRRYDALGHLAGFDYPDKTSYEVTWSDKHDILTAQGPSGLVWKYAYNEEGLLARTENPEGAAHEYEFDDYGQVISVTTPAGATYRYHYDQLGYFVGFSSPLATVKRHQVDARGNVLAIVTENGSTSQYAYDRFDRMVDALGPDGRKWHFEYDYQGRIHREYLPTGQYVEYEYNTCGLPIAARRTDGVVLKCDWDTEPGRVLALHDGNGNSLRYAYDPLGRPVERQNWDGIVTRYTYNAGGRVSAVDSADGTRQEFVYDDFGQIVQRRSGDFEINFEYDVNGFMIAALGPEHELRWERDLYGRPLSEMQDEHRIEYQYDQAGRCTSLQTALGEAIEFEYNIASQLTKLTFGDQDIRFDYNPLGQELTRQFSGGGRFERQYDPSGRLVREAYSPPRSPAPPLGKAPGVDPLPVSREYFYNATSAHLELVRDSLRGGTQLTHDALGQLRAAVRYWGFAEYFDFDAAGNRTTTARVTSAAPPLPVTAFAPGFGANSMKQDALRTAGAEIETRTIGPGNLTTVVTRANEALYYEFDETGFLKQKTVSALGAPNKVWRFGWNVEGHLTELITPDGSVWKYEYDPLGRRLVKEGPPGKTRFVWERRRLLHVLQDGASPVTLVSDPVAFELLLRKQGSDASFVIPDHLSAVSELVGADGVLDWWRVGDAWGKSPTMGEGEPGFPGQWLDRESGLFYNDHRYYDPDLGRYISPDPIGLLGGLNEYAYVASPFQGYDPHGLAKALGGGPMDYGGTFDDQGRPDLRSQNSSTGRQVTSNSTPTDQHGNYGTNNVPPPGSGATPDSGGKCLAVMTGGETPQAFVSGQGRQPNTANPNPSFPVDSNQYVGNYTHAEVQALEHLHASGVQEGNFQLFIDRPCCPKCQVSVQAALDALPEGVKVKVFYQKTTKNGVEWEEFDGKAKAPADAPCH